MESSIDHAVAEQTAVRLIVGPDEMNEIVHVDVDVVIHFKNEVDLAGAVLPHPVEHGRMKVNPIFLSNRKKDKKKRNKKTGIELSNLFPFFRFFLFASIKLLSFQCYWVVTMAVWRSATPP
jgi:hypothetical protein